ncbi:MAG: class I adenylate-forming enzyme family protein [Candidatus Latescibacterota bacterium]
MLLQQFLEKSSQRFPEKTALVSEGLRIGYSELDGNANRIARGILDLGVRRGDRVLVFTRSRPEAVLSIFGALKAGAVFSVVPDTARAANIQHLTEVTEPGAILVDPDLLPVLEEAGIQAGESRRIVLTRLPGEKGSIPHPSFDDFASLSGEKPDIPIIDIDLASLIFTSGSRGAPKGIMLTHLNMISAAQSIISYIGNREDDIILDVLPLSFDYGLYQALMAFAFGGTVVIEPSFAYPVRILKLLEEEAVTGFPVLPTICALLEKLRLFRESRFPGIRYVTNTGAALPPGSIRALRRSFPEARIFSMYGLSECKRVSYLPPGEIDARPLSVGKAMPNCEIWLEDESGSRLPNGAAGELMVRGANVALGYWRMPEETEAAFRPGSLPGERVLHTGDLFRTDDEGYLYFLGRKDDMLKCRGQKVYPREIEDAALGMPGILEAVAVGFPDDILGHAIRLYLVFEDGMARKSDEIKKYLISRLEDYKVPGMIDVCSELPRNTSGKADRLVLKNTAEQLKEAPSPWALQES